MTIDYLIVAASVLVTLIIGWYAGRGIKDIREYAITNQTYGTQALTLTLLATIMGGNNVINGPNSVISVGIITRIAYCGVFTRYIFTALCIAPNMKYFKGCLTMGDVAEKLYGKYSKVLTGILATLFALLATSMQFLALAIICQLLHISAGWSIGVGGILLALYTAHGGMKAVTLTDIFQFIVLFVGFMLLANVAVSAVGSPEVLFQKLPAEKLQIIGHEKFSYYLTFFIIVSVFPTNISDPTHFQRLLMARDGRQLRQAYLLLATCYPLALAVTTLVGLVGLALYPNLTDVQIVPHLIDTLLPVGLKGVAIAGLLAVVISTGDSYLHTAGLMLTRDVVKPLCEQRKITIDELKWARYSTFIIGCLAAVFAWCVQGESIVAQTFFKVNLFALQLVAPVLMFPLIAGIMGLRTEKSHFYAATVTTFIAFLAAQVLLSAQQRHLAALIGILTNFVTFFGMHLVQHGGIAIVDRRSGQHEPPQEV